MARNPKKALAAAIPRPVKTGRGITVAPMTLALWAVLEELDSPVITGKPPKSTAEMIPSAYLLVHGAAEFWRDDFTARAFAWADTVPAGVLADIAKAARRQIQTVLDVIPETDGKKKATTAGSRPS